MGNANGGAPVYGSYAQQQALETWLRDIGVVSDLPMAEADDRWSDDWVPNQASHVGWQFSMLPRAFALCGCGVYVESMRLHWDDGPALPEAFRRAVGDVIARGQLQRCVDGCQQPRCVVPLAWWWDPALFPGENQNEHLTLLVLDRVSRVQWFFDPDHPNDRDIPMTDWMETAALVPGFQPRTVRFARDGNSLQSYLWPLAGDDKCVSGACTGVSLLLAVALWRFGVPEPALLLAAVANWLEDLVGNPHQHRTVRRRLIRWQHAVTHATDRRRVFRLFGLTDAVGDVSARPCAVFRGSGICDARCAVVYDGDSADSTRTVRLTLCRAHAAVLVDPVVVSSVPPLPSPPP
jgi:hypothetical protein